MIKHFLNEISGIHFIDIGSSGELDTKWKPLEPFIHLTGFDPNVVECDRMSSLPHQFRSLNYLPYALAGSKGVQTLYKTKSIYCYSLLKPNFKWLNRFSFRELFELTGEEKINTVKLSEVDHLKGVDIDVVKVDTQGLELPILSNAGDIVDKAFFIETETGFLENYHGETTFAEISEFMRSNNFLLFDMNINHRISRYNVFKDTHTGAEQILWCEATWLKDYVYLINHNVIHKRNFDRAKALKVLILCALQGCVDYGYELAELFQELKLIDEKELRSLESKENWRISGDTLSNKNKTNVLNLVLRLLPAHFRSKLGEEAKIASRQKHLFHFKK